MLTMHINLKSSCSYDRNDRQNGSGYLGEFLQWTRDNVSRHSGSSHWGQAITGIHWVEAMNASTHPTMHKTAPTTKNYPVQNGSPRDTECCPCQKRAEHFTSWESMCAIEMLSETDS